MAENPLLLPTPISQVVKDQIRGQTRGSVNDDIISVGTLNRAIDNADWLQQQLYDLGMSQEEYNTYQ